ncbi:MAG: hypothetical protein JSW08_02260 [archaeon]|nr:MAG: hypothetical protein JSW08_02260 [archaeon]
MDIFNEVIMCSKCKKRLAPIHVEKNGFKIRTLECSKCGKRIYHPADVEEYKKFKTLRQQPFAVKLRIVGNSYTVSIPRQIINFMREQENIHEQMHKKMKEMSDKMVRMMLEESGKLSLFFDEENKLKQKKKNEQQS